MSFTEDELQSFNTILEQRLQAHQRDMERALDQRMNEYRREHDQRLGTVQVDVQRGVSQKLSDFQIRLETMLSEKLNTQPARLIQALNREIEQRQQQFEGNIDRIRTIDGHRHRASDPAWERIHAAAGRGRSALHALGASGAVRRQGVPAAPADRQGAHAVS